ncbi:MAG: Rrf2 family transcriptional regulator [Chloroflexi bacterium]|jgi:cysteine desulfurase|nr:Rrf2 family transcriptional regulator [Chloroflexota bacterium]
MRLQLTRRSDYAIRASIVLALEAPGRSYLPAPRIAERMRIPPSVIPQVLGDLSRAGIVETAAGKNGGYRLVRPAVLLPVLDVIEAVEGPSRAGRCSLGDRGCDGADPCALHETWTAAQTAFIDVLAGTSLADLAAAHLASADASGPHGPEEEHS